VEATDGKRFRDLLRGMGRMYGQEPDSLVLDAYWIALRDWDYTDFEAAAAHLMATAKFMPRPAEFNALRKAGQPTAHEAWETAIANCTSWRDGKSTAGDLIDRVVRSIGGYRVIAMADQEHDLPHIQRRFLEAYDALSVVDPARQAVPQIAAVGARIALRGPAPLANFLPQLQQPKGQGQ
jgi:hypothetical protein